MRKLTDIKEGLARGAFTIPEFCISNRISRATLYGLWHAKIGPRRMEIGTKKLISVEAAADWRRAREEAFAVKHPD
jgi:hypothetical protein